MIYFPVDNVCRTSCDFSFQLFPKINNGMLKSQRIIRFESLVWFSIFGWNWNVNEKGEPNKATH